MGKEITKREKLSISEIKAEFGAEGEVFDNNEIEKIREFLYLLAQISYEQYNRDKQTAETSISKLINIKTTTDEHAKSNNIYPCEYGRTG